MTTLLTLTVLLLALLGTLPELLDYVSGLWSPALLADDAAWTAEVTAAAEADHARFVAELAEVVRLRHVASCRAWLALRAEALDQARGTVVREIGPRRPTAAQVRRVQPTRLGRPITPRLPGWVAYWRTFEAGPSVYVGPTRERLWDVAPVRRYTPPVQAGPAPRVMLRDRRGRWFNALSA